MKKFSDIQDITPEELELLEAAGYTELNALQGISIGDFQKEITRANDMLNIASETPTREKLAAWYAIAEVELPEAPQKPAYGSPSELQAKVPEFGEAVEIPVAVSISQEFIEAKQIDLSGLPKVGDSLGMSSGLNPVKERGAQKQEADAPIAQYRVQATSDSKTDHEKVIKQLEKDKVLSMDEFRVKGGKVAPLERASGTDITKTTLEETNRGIDPKSRRYIRGVLHREPAKVTLASIALLFSQLLVILSVLPLPLIFIDRDKYIWAAFCPLLAIVALFIWFFVARKAQCPVCRQHQYVPKACLKHNKAHRLPLIGHMASTAIHVLMFKWFRCIFCGTSIRLKE